MVTTSKIPEAQLTEWVLLSPEGKFFSVPKELFNAVRYFSEEEQNGSVTIHFNHGKIQCVEGLTRKSFHGS